MVATRYVTGNTVKAWVEEAGLCCLVFKFRMILAPPALWRCNTPQCLGKNFTQLSRRQEGRGGGCWGMNWKKPWVPHGDGPFVENCNAFSETKLGKAQSISSFSPSSSSTIPCLLYWSEPWAERNERCQKMPVIHRNWGIEKNKRGTRTRTATKSSGCGRTKRKEGGWERKKKRERERII